MRIILCLVALLFSAAAAPLSSTQGGTSTNNSGATSGNVPVFGAGGAMSDSGTALSSLGASTIPVTTIATSGASQSVAFPTTGSKAYDITLSAGCTITLTGGTAGQYQTVILVIRTGAGGFATTLPTGVLWPGGVTPTPSQVASQVNVFTISTSDGGTTLIGGYSP